MKVYPGNIIITLDTHEIKAIEDCIETLKNISNTMKKNNITDLYDDNINYVSSQKIKFMCDHLLTLLNCKEGNQEN